MRLFQVKCFFNQRIEYLIYYKQYISYDRAIECIFKHAYTLFLLYYTITIIITITYDFNCAN